MLAIKTILHPTDFSESAALAFTVACSLAKDYGARLIVLHVATPPAFVVGAEVGVLPEEPEGYREELQTKLNRLVSQVSDVLVEHRMVEGNAPTEILRIAEEAKCDLVVMGTHGRTGLGRLLIGSIAEQIVRNAACPVLTVKIPQKVTT